MKEIDSIKDEIFKVLRECRTAKGREELGMFLVEDDDVFTAINAGASVCDIVVIPEFAKAKPAGLQGLQPYVMKKAMMKKLFSGGKLPNIIATIKKKECRLSDFTTKKFILVMEGVQQASNIGMMMRTAEGLGVEGIVVIADGITELYSRNVIQASRGSFFRMPMALADRGQALAFLRNNAFTTIATSSHTDKSLSTYTVPEGPIAVAVGNETNGVTDSILDAADDIVAIPMQGNIESLNVVVSAGIVLYAINSA